MTPAALARELDDSSHQSPILREIKYNNATTISPRTLPDRLPTRDKHTTTNKALTPARCSCHTKPHYAAWQSPGQDECRCACSYRGCTITTKFLSGMVRYEQIVSDSLTLHGLSALLYNWYKVMAAMGNSLYNIHEEVERWVAFEKLDLTHTCCKIMTDPDEDKFEIKWLAADDIDEICDEERELLHHLEIMLHESDSDWWNSPSRFDFLLEVSLEEPPPTLRWANLWLARRLYNLDEEACDKIRSAAGIEEADFWGAIWSFWSSGKRFESVEPANTCSRSTQGSAETQWPKIRTDRLGGMPWIYFDS